MILLNLRQDISDEELISPLCLSVLASFQERLLSCFVCSLVLTSEFYKLQKALWTEKRAKRAERRNTFSILVGALGTGERAGSAKICVA